MEHPRLKIRFGFTSCFGKGEFRETEETLSVDRSDASEVARVAKQNIPKMVRTFDINARLLNPDDCCRAVIADETDTILLIPQNELKIDDRLLDSASVVNSTAR